MNNQEYNARFCSAGRGNATTTSIADNRVTRIVKIADIHILSAISVGLSLPTERSYTFYTAGFRTSTWGVRPPITTQHFLHEWTRKRTATN